MNQSTLPSRAWILSVTTQAICLAAAFFIATRADPSVVVEVPETTAPTPSESLAMIVAATGVRVEEGRVRKAAPEAEPFDSRSADCRFSATL